MNKGKGIFLGIESTTNSDVIIKNDAVLVLGECKIGKTAGVTIPTLRNYSGSAIIIDKNGEIYREISNYIDDEKTSCYQFLLPNESVNLSVFIKKILPDLLTNNHRFILDISFESHCTEDKICIDIENLFKTAINLRNTTSINDDTHNLLFCIDEYPKGKEKLYNLNFIFNKINDLKEKHIQPLLILQSIPQIEMLYGNPIDFLNKFDYILMYYSSPGLLMFFDNIKDTFCTKKNITEIKKKSNSQCFLINTRDTSKNCFITKELYFVNNHHRNNKMIKKLSTLVGCLK